MKNRKIKRVKSLCYSLLKTKRIDVGIVFSYNPYSIYLIPCARLPFHFYPYDNYNNKIYITPQIEFLFFDIRIDIVIFKKGVKYGKQNI